MSNINWLTFKNCLSQELRDAYALRILVHRKCFQHPILSSCSTKIFVTIGEEVLAVRILLVMKMFCHSA